MSIRTEQLTCVRCSKILVAYDIWQAATKDERRVMKAEGKARGVRRDICAACYQYLRVHGELHRYTPQHGGNVDPGAGPCSRCGQPTVVLGSLCRDCADVTLDLDERERWSS